MLSVTGLVQFLNPRGGNPWGPGGQYNIKRMDPRGHMGESFMGE